MFPRPALIPSLPCRSCGTPARVDRMTDGMGERCARDAGLITATPRLRPHVQSGPDLFDYLDEEDHCDGWDR